MGWNDLLSNGETRTLPWLGGRALFDRRRRWAITGGVPPEVGWHRFEIAGGRRARWLGPGERDPEFERGHELLRGYLVGDRLIPDQAAVRLDVHAIFDASERVWLAEPGLDRFARARVVRRADRRLIYMAQEFPQGPEFEVLEAWQDRADNIDDIAGVTPALQLAFLWLSWRRFVAEEREADEARRVEQAAAAERVRETEARRLQAFSSLMGRSAHTRRHAALRDFGAAARVALEVSGAELLDHRDNAADGEKIVQFRFKRRRFECVVKAETLRVVDAGICLIDHATGERGDERFTLESLPAVIDEATRRGVLHVFRRV